MKTRYSIHRHLFICPHISVNAVHTNDAMGRCHWSGLVSMYFWTIAKICAYVIPVLLAHLLIGPLFRLHILIALCYKGTCE